MTPPTHKIIQSPACAWRNPFAVLAVFFVLCAAAQAQPYLHPVFTSDMVVQREAVVPVWGWTTPGAQVGVSFAGASANATADATGKWRAELGPFAAGGPHTMAITGPQSVTLTNVMIGDVWLCMGQSNMERDMSDAQLLDAAAERADSANYPNIRHFKVQSDAAQGAVARTPQMTLPAGSGPWKAASPSTSGGFSAVGYFMARALNQHTGVAMGILNASKGSSRHAPWMSSEAAEGISDFTGELFTLDTQTINDLQTVCVRHNAMVAPLIGFPIRGIVWYQGESSTSLGDQYHAALPALIADWRAKFGADLPVVVIQLSTYANWSTVPVRVFDTYPIVREAQLNAAKADPNTALVCTLDTGDSASPADIHPKNKQDVGKRAARAMRQIAYAEAIEGQGPIFSHAVVEGSAMRCHFTNTGEGLMVGTKAPNDTTPVAQAVGGTALFGFALTSKASAPAEADWKAATAAIDPATNTVVVSSPEVPSPVHVRYAWATNPHNFGAGNSCNLYSKITDGNGTVTDGLPASPFRSDPKAWIKVNGGTGSTTVTTPKAPGSVVSITAGAAPIGQEFAGWQGDTGALAAPSAGSTSATVTAGYTSVRAAYRFTTPPANFAVGIFGNEAALSWDAMSGARYSVYRSESGGAPVLLATGIEASSFTDATISPGGSYSYSVSADLPGSTGPTGFAAPAVPFGVGTFSFVAGGAEIQFPTVVGKTYQLERSFQLGNWTEIGSPIPGTGQSRTVSDLPPSPETRVFYRVRAR